MESVNFLQYLIPAIFLIIWVIGKIFNPKKAESQPRKSSEIFEVIDTATHHFDILPVPSKPQAELRPLVHAIKPSVASSIDSSKSPINQQERAQLFTLLEDSQSVKRAFLTSEILGRPVALRRNGNTGAYWEEY